MTLGVNTFMNKGTHTVCVSISFYNVNQKLVSPKTICNCENHMAKQMALSFNENVLTEYILLQDQTTLRVSNKLLHFGSWY